MDTDLVTRNVLLHGDDPEAKRQEIRRYFHKTFALYERLFDLLATSDAWYRKAIPLRHPLIFYFGHTAVFYVNKLNVAKITGQRLNPRFESIFAVGVDEMLWDDLDESHYDWPDVDTVREYRQQVRDLVDGVIATMPISLPIGWDSPWWAILMGIEHERIHLETSSVLIRQLPLEHVRSDPHWLPCGETGPAPDNALLPVPGGVVRMGKKRDHPLYGWDNEYGDHQASLKGFDASRHLVSNAEFLSFVEANGYTQRQWWTEEGDAWRRYANAHHPTFWAHGPEGWRLRVLAEEVPMPWDWPVEVNCYEAQAFCAWKSGQLGIPLRLPSEDEWRRLRDHCAIPDEPCWVRAPGNINLEWWASPCPVGRFPQGDFHDVIGNVWQWTATPIHPFEGFAVHPYYDDFTTPTFDNAHYLMKGGSFISTGNEAALEARYAFRRHFFQHAGFRYVSSENPLLLPGIYESDALLAQYADFHYGPEHFGVPNFPEAIARIALAAMDGRPKGRALELGCAVGRTSFELARAFPEVTGLDFSARFIQVGVALQERGEFRYILPEEGELVSYHTARLADLDLNGTVGRVTFFQADACNLKPLYTGYDLIVAANLIDRLYSPRRFLAQLDGRLRPGGILLIASPYTWTEEHTRREEWLGGFKKDGEDYTTLQALKEILAPHFRLVGDPVDVPFVIRETARKFQHTLSQVTLWERLP